MNDFAKLAQMRDAIRRLPSTTTAIAAKAAPEVSDLARASWASGVSAYGVPYAPNADGTKRTLNRSGALGASIRFVSVGTKLRCVLGVPYARYQIKNGILPRGGAILPRSWIGSIQKISELEISVRLRA